MKEDGNPSLLSPFFFPFLRMQKFGEVEDCRDQDANTVVMTFKTRSEAENVRVWLRSSLKRVQKKTSRS